MTPEQAIIIAKLAYGQADWIKSEFEITYHPYEPEDRPNDVYEDSPEFMTIKFKAITFGTTVDDIRLQMISNFNLSMNIMRPTPASWIQLGISNQFLIFKQLQEWGFNLD